MNEAKVEVKATTGEVLGRAVIDKNTDPWTVKEITRGWMIETWDGDHLIPVLVREVGEPVRRLMKFHYYGDDQAVRRELERVKEAMARSRRRYATTHLRGRRN